LYSKSTLKAAVNFLVREWSTNNHQQTRDSYILIPNHNAQYNKNDLMAIIIYSTHYIL